MLLFCFAESASRRLPTSLPAPSNIRRSINLASPWVAAVKSRQISVHLRATFKW